ncbi:MAG TPA: SDR family oxidoreductase [Longimicrobiales bacterium]|nr:SDR family oxidoreductase [Longimicrobiales bacterium]
MSILVTGATGLVGAAVIEKLLRDDGGVRILALVRGHAGWAALAARLGPYAARVVPIRGDVTLARCGLDAATSAALSHSVHAVIHCAADTSFSRPLAEARAVNTAGTQHVLDLVEGWPLERFVYVSTAFVAGMRTGAILPHELAAGHGFVNGYEQSKHEAELLVRASGLPCSVLRPSTIVCDDVSGSVTQVNAVHRALRVFHAGLASMMPGDDATTVDVVPNDYVAECVVELGLRAAPGWWHVCAGAGALPLREMLDGAHAVWSRDARWRGRGILPPVLTDLATYRLFEASVEDTGDVRLATITRSLSHFVPQLALPKQFDTSRTDAALGRSAPRVSEYWARLVERLVAERWCAAARAA